MDTQKIEALWTHLHWLNVLASQGTYTAAAARLGVSKAAVSQRIQALEQSLGLSHESRTPEEMGEQRRLLDKLRMFGA